ncbi:MAG: hypothetical protein ICV83_28215, partial [Cytophagales bacterium]|nr:hypothetical protein [Cytophagales bacterium]
HTSRGNGFSAVKMFRWTGSMLLAAVLTLGVAALVMHHGDTPDMNRLTPFQYWVVYLAVPSVALGLFVFLSCLFVPSHKAYAGRIVVALGGLLVGCGSYQHYIDNGFLPGQYIVRYSGFVLGLAVGYLLSYKVFKTNHWYGFNETVGSA